MDLSLIQILTGGALSGLAGAAAMYGFMRTISARFSTRVDMILAVGSLINGRIENARLTGTAVHAVSGMLFGVLYFYLLALSPIDFIFGLIGIGLAIGFVHGLVVSYALMLFVSDRHPVAEFRQVTLETGLLHFVGHLLFGLTVGLLSGLILRVAI